MSGKVVVLGTGGTIASKVDPATGSAVAAVSGAELVETIKGRGLALPEGVEVEAEQVCTVGSFLFDLDLAFRIARRAGERLAEADVLGVVVTQGTDTMEETVWLADLVVNAEKPVIFTGAQFHADEADSDGPRNLADSIKVAASPEARGLGAMIVFEQEIHAARDATKRHAARRGTFFSAEHGKLGEIDGLKVVIHRRPLLREHVAAQAIEPRIDLIRLVMGSDARFIRHAVETGARGLVIEAFGRGNANHEVVEGIREAVAKGVAVVVTSRCPEGRVKPVYGQGGGRDVDAAGAIFAGDLTGPKARVLLAVLLGEPGVGDVRAVVERLGG